MLHRTIDAEGGLCVTNSVQIIGDETVNRVILRDDTGNQLSVVEYRFNGRNIGRSFQILKIVPMQEVVIVCGLVHHYEEAALFVWRVGADWELELLLRDTFISKSRYISD